MSVLGWLMRGSGMLRHWSRFRPTVSGPAGRRTPPIPAAPESRRPNALAPSFVITNINRALFERMQAGSAPWEPLLDQHLLRGLDEPRDAANAALFLASDEARWITRVTPVDGGYTAH